MTSGLAMFDVNVITADEAQRVCEQAVGWNETSSNPKPSYADKPTVVGVHPVYGRFGLTPSTVANKAVLFTEDGYVFELERGS